jgi:hypothetical protein
MQQLGLKTHSNYEYHELIVQRKYTELDFCDFLRHTKFEMDRFAMPLDFWFELNRKKDDEWILLTDELISLIGFKSCASNRSSSRSNLFRFININFSENIDFCTNPIGLVQPARGGTHRKLEMHMKKRPFKKMLLKVGTETSDLIHDYLLDMEQAMMQYMVYQKECQMVKNTDLQKEISNLKKYAPPPPLLLESDYSKLSLFEKEKHNYRMMIQVDTQLRKVYGNDYDKKRRRRRSYDSSGSDGSDSDCV